MSHDSIPISQKRKRRKNKTKQKQKKKKNEHITKGSLLKGINGKFLRNSYKLFTSDFIIDRYINKIES